MTWLVPYLGLACGLLGFLLGSLLGYRAGRRDGEASGRVSGLLESSEIRHEIEIRRALNRPIRP